MHMQSQIFNKQDQFPVVSLVGSQLYLDGLYHKAISTVVKSDDNVLSCATNHTLELSRFRIIN